MFDGPVVRLAGSTCMASGRVGSSTTSWCRGASPREVPRWSLVRQCTRMRLCSLRSPGSAWRAP
eukprot:1364343-Pyramimonas_sp.AAC.1